MTLRTRTIAVVILALCVVIVITSSVLLKPKAAASEAARPSPGASGPSSPGPLSTSRAIPVAAIPATQLGTAPATALLADLPVKAALPISGYNRTGDFGAAWLDEDRNGCDTRDDILTRDLSAITKSGSCRVLSGTLVSPYTAATIHFVRGVKTSALVQIDHLVALGDAWQTGAQSLTQAQRLDLANDPLELMAVDGRSNDEKSDKDAAQWLPPNVAFDCAYVARQISVKVTYSLWVTPAEHDAMARVLAGCGLISGTASTLATG